MIEKADTLEQLSQRRFISDVRRFVSNLCIMVDRWLAATHRDHTGFTLGCGPDDGGAYSTAATDHHDGPIVQGSVELCHELISGRVREIQSSPVANRRKIPVNQKDL
jgi:hypothetical protein